MHLLHELLRPSVFNNTTDRYRACHFRQLHLNQRHHSPDSKAAHYLADNYKSQPPSFFQHSEEFGGNELRFPGLRRITYNNTIAHFRRPHEKGTTSLTRSCNQTVLQVLRTSHREAAHQKAGDRAHCTQICRRSRSA